MKYSKLQNDKLYLIDNLFDEVTAELFINNIDTAARRNISTLVYKYVNYSLDEIKQKDIVRMCRTLDIPYSFKTDRKVFDIVMIELDVSQYL